MSETVISSELESSARKKTKITEWITSSFESNTSVDASASEPRKRKLLQQYPKKISKLHKDEDETWVQRHAPKSTEDLAVHKKKVLEVETWITQNPPAKKGGAPILLLTGPPGSGKTATVVVIARKHDIYIEEWSNPLTTPFSVSRQAGLFHQSQVGQFEEFLFRSGKYDSVVISSNPASNPESTSRQKLILLEDLPNFIYRDPSRIVDLLRRYRKTQRWPLILILSDGSTSDPIKRLLRSSHLPTITFNLISPSIMTKALTRICAAERRVIPKDDVSLMSSTGDIRAAINCLQFSSPLETLSQDAKKQKKVSGCNSSLSAKDTTMILFRALGKIFYCKRKKVESNKLVKVSKTHRDPLVVEPETILEQCCLSGNAFGLFLHHNYLSFFNNNSVDDVSTAAEYLSSADLMNSALTSCDPSSGASASLDYYEGVLSARGLVYSNSSRATSELCSSCSGSWRPLHKPSWYEVRRQEQDNRLTSHRLFWKQQDDLPMLLPFASRFDPPQRNFIREVVAISKWKSFSSHDDRLNERESGVNAPEINDASLSGDVEVKVNLDEDEEVIIEEFSD